MEENSIEVNAENVQKIMEQTLKMLRDLPQHEPLSLIETFRVYHWPEETIKMALGDAYIPPSTKEELEANK